MKVLVVFGSKSDQKVYDKIANGLKKNKIDYELRICSAHKTPEELDKVLETDYDVVIAGAGLAAHLPGVIASKTITPIIGVPCKVDYEGLDALLSIVQMPPGIPVLSAGVDEADIVVEETIKIFKKYGGVNLIGNKNNKILKKAEEILKEFNVDYEITEKTNDKRINIRFVNIDKETPKEKKELVIYCPLSDQNTAGTATMALQRSSRGLWVGLHNGVNAAIAAIEILSLDGKYDDKLSAYRKKMGDKVRKADKDVR